MPRLEYWESGALIGLWLRVKGSRNCAQPSSRSVGMG